MYLVRCGNCKCWHSITRHTPCICFCTRTYFRKKNPHSPRVYVYNEPGCTSTIWFVDDKQFDIRTKGMKVVMKLVGKDPNVFRVSKGKMIFAKGGKHML